MDLGAIGVTLYLKHYQQQNIDLSVPIIIEPYKLVVPWPEEENRLLAPIRPFQPLVWLALGITLLVLAPVLAIVSGIYLKYVDPTNPHYYPGRPIISVDQFMDNEAFLLSHLTNQGEIFNLKYQKLILIL